MPFVLSNTTSELLNLDIAEGYVLDPIFFVWFGFLSFIENSLDFIWPYYLVATDDYDDGEEEEEEEDLIAMLRHSRVTYIFKPHQY